MNEEWKKEGYCLSCQILVEEQSVIKKTHSTADRLGRWRTVTRWSCKECKNGIWFPNKLTAKFYALVHLLLFFFLGFVPILFTTDKQDLIDHGISFYPWRLLSIPAIIFFILYLIKMSSVKKRNALCKVIHETTKPTRSTT